MELSRAVLGNVTVVAAMGRCSNEHLVLASSAVLMLVLLAVAARRCTDVGALIVVSSVDDQKRRFKGFYISKVCICFLVSEFFAR